jgi:cytochrome c oxidase cbb3-type subunit 3
VTRLRASGLLLAALAAAAGCDSAELPRGLAGSPAIHTSGPVGPLPGLGDAPPSAGPYDGQPAMIADGRKLFVSMNCAGCHGDHAGGGMGPSLRDATWIYGSQPGDVYDSIAQGRANGMPSWGVMLPEQLIWQLTAYIGSLGTDRESEPPQ